MNQAPSISNNQKRITAVGVKGSNADPFSTKFTTREDVVGRFDRHAGDTTENHTVLTGGGGVGLGGISPQITGRLKKGAMGAGG